MNSYVLTLRSWARKSGLLRPIKMIQSRLLQTRYEERFGDRMLAEVRPGDVVWDIGANLGYYTERFLDRVGSQGSVVAFEPAPACYQALHERFGASRNVLLENAGVGRAEGRATLAVDADPLAATHQIGARASSGGPTVEVAIVSGDAYLARTKTVPQVMKIDTEGFEEEVLMGMTQLLKNPRLRAIFCEVHFSLLEARGERMAPVRIEKLLRASGFAVTWIDASHIAAVRP